ncbi:Proline dehydrogenase 1 [Jeotgalicoccus aerolatus]|uniref:proline dehydrogenase n=1 Tax=Jeotgalicoccus aerolatus TaxID=709510 RepID=A0A1G9BJD9_9STAP|nr:proline dehydrogenase family protein [Jeotgalicoccus aerolatus]MBP1952593.1 proline dehydrogenase [Jeotgalicoccus aerolatus]CAD2074313.1 Proline dehydrogenase 1 [Jeotgalicoccus aerolatus]SDK39571.1 L-proline dehydrogenase [Jeotgalicoccus aerolatus]GGD92464.1 proline dehydrogenase [Jeotgalicoccus aerolatus]HJG32450.1 proline dehydrogenase family protein [Jeotgalicoccus aerolatus]
MGVVRDLFIGLSENEILNDASKKMGLRFGAQKVVGGTGVDDTLVRFADLNNQGMSITFDNLGEFISDRKEAEKEKNNIIKMIKAVNEKDLTVHASVKLSQIGLNIDETFCYENIKEILDAAKEANMFVNLDMENYLSKGPSLTILDKLLEEYDNVGTVIQAYFYDAKKDVRKYKDIRTRLVKGAYKEPATIAYQSKADIDQSYFEIIKTHLVEGNGFTSIATHDHNIIEKTIRFIETMGISKDEFEFQMLYGFRKDYQQDLVARGYNMCVYVPYGTDWYAYFMRRLAERPQNLNLVVKSFTSNDKVKYGAIAAAAVAGVALLAKAFKTKK